MYCAFRAKKKRYIIRILTDKWIGDTAYIANINLPNTTFVMPYHAAVVTATYKTQGGAVNTLTVTNGTGGGTYLPGTVVDIAADIAITGKIFDRWTGNTANIENINRKFSITPKMGT